MTARFRAAVDLILHVEDRTGRGLVTVDAGGVTRWGISKRAFPKLNIENLSREEATEIYRLEYWDRMRCDDLPPAIAVLAFDCAVNQGAGTAARLLQRAAKVKADGVLGPVTLRACHADARNVALRYAAKRAKRYASTSGADVNLDGWLFRLFEVFSVAVATTGTEHGSPK